jgi:peptidoglycan biosynthesis protein MviN/MurJ (putative lipid II flippase)
MTAFAAIVTTTIWYINAPNDKYKLGMLSLFFWGATIMWLIDHVMAYLKEGGEFFATNADATLLGILVIVLALFIWQIVLLVCDPKGAWKRVLISKR